MDLNASFSKAIKELRAKEGLTQDELAEMLDLSRKQIQNIEQCRSLPSVPVLYQLYDKFHLSVDSVFACEKHPAEAAMKELAMELSVCDADQIRQLSDVIRKILSFHQRQC